MNERHTQRVIDVLGLEDASAVISVSRPNQATARVQLTAEQRGTLLQLMQSWLAPAEPTPTETFEQPTSFED
mgnify:CR=1 FL=1